MTEISMNGPAFNEMQQVKRLFFALRNGIITETIRKAGYSYKIIFGLNLPQLKEIAQGIGLNKNLSVMLRENATTRESLLLSPMIYPIEELTFEEALSWANGSQTTEVADILCHSLLRRYDKAEELCDVLVNEDNYMGKYCGLRLLLNIPSGLKENVKEICQREIDSCSPLRYIAKQVLDDKEQIM